jgi:hypothetical protein
MTWALARLQAAASPNDFLYHTSNILFQTKLHYTTTPNLHTNERSWIPSSIQHCYKLFVITLTWRPPLTLFFVSCSLDWPRLILCCVPGCGIALFARKGGPLLGIVCDGKMASLLLDIRHLNAACDLTSAYIGAVI